MNEKIEALYARIGQALNHAVGGKFRTAHARVEMADDFGSVGVFFEVRQGDFHYRTDEDDELYELFTQLRRQCIQAGMGSWSQATFTLSQGGNFSLQFGFEDISDMGQASERRDRWMQEHLGPDARVIWS